MHFFEITFTYVRINELLKVGMFSWDSLNMKLLLYFGYCSKRLFAAFALLLTIYPGVKFFLSFCVYDANSLRWKKAVLDPAMNPSSHSNSKLGFPFPVTAQ